MLTDQINSLSFHLTHIRASCMFVAPNSVGHEAAAHIRGKIKQKRKFECLCELYECATIHSPFDAFPLHFRLTTTKSETGYTCNLRSLVGSHTRIIHIHHMLVHLAFWFSYARKKQNYHAHTHSHTQTQTHRRLEVCMLCFFLSVM